MVSDRQTNGLKLYIQCNVSRVIEVFFVVFTLYFVGLVKKVRVCYSLIAESCKMIHEMTNFLSA